MARKVKVLTTCFHEEYRDGVTSEQNLEKVGETLDSLHNSRPDLICLPEVFLEGGVRNRPGSKDMAEILFNMLSEKARSLGSYIIAGAYEYIGTDFCNVAWLIDRSGKLAGRYIKHYPTLHEMEKGIRPGNEVPVFQTDFGTIGMLVCFDIDWPEIWSSLASKGAEMVIWISAYEGGFPLQAYAATNFYHVISSVRVSISKIIDNTGKILASTSKWMGWVMKEIDMEKTIFHLDEHYEKIYKVKKQLGDKIILECLPEENRFTIESNDAQWPVSRIMQEFGIETFKEYHRRTETVQDKMRMK